MRKATLTAFVVVIVAVAALLASLGLGGAVYGVKDFTVACGTSATAIASSDAFGYSTVWCDNNSGTSIYIGGADVDTSGVCLSTSSASCGRRDLPTFFDIGVNALYCRTSGGTHNLNCLAGK